VLDGVSEIVKQLEQSAANLIDQGNHALATQQLLLAGMLRGVLNDLSATYKDALSQTANTVAVGESNLERDVRRIIKDTHAVVQGTAAEAHAVIYQTQGAINQLLSRLPLTRDHPVFYGATVYDLYSELPSSGYDLDLLGFNLTDPDLDLKVPVIAVNGSVVPPDGVSVEDDRVKVRLPATLKDELGLTGGYCTARAPLTVSMEVYHGKRRGIWPIRWVDEWSVPFKAFVPPSPSRYEASLSVTGTTATTTAKPVDFKDETSAVIASCDETRDQTLSYALPNDAYDVHCSADWEIHRSARSKRASCNVIGTTAVATGTLRGIREQCVNTPLGRVCNCDHSSKGFLKMRGSYKVPETTMTPYVSAAPRLVDFESMLSSSLGVPSNTRLQLISVTIRRKGCADVIDTIEAALPADPNLKVVQSSAHGDFELTYSLGQIELRKMN
jgi:hypothetical protein